MTPELLPCPFCNGESLSFEDREKSGDPYVVCDDCGASGGTEGTTEEHAAESWNRRVGQVDARKLERDAVIEECARLFDPLTFGHYEHPSKAIRALKDKTHATD